MTRGDSAVSPISSPVTAGQCRRLDRAPGYEVKVLAIGLVAGIILDATVIRALLVPALMRLLGDGQLEDAQVDAHRTSLPRREPARA